MDSLRLGLDHRYIFIPEIVDFICEEADSSRHRLKTLSRLARTCRFFHESALDYLWKEITGIHILIKCMPQSLSNDTVSSQGRTLQLTRAIIPSDCARLMSYACRIKSFKSFDGLLFYTFESILKMYQALDVLMETNILLQNIKTLYWDHQGDDTFPYIRLFLGPNLLDLAMAVGPASSNLSFLYTPQGRHLHLHSFCMWGSQGQGTTDVVSGAIRGWSQLRSLSVPNLKRPMLMHLMHLTNLRNLTMGFYEQEPTPFSISSSSHHSHIGFSSLESFTLRACADLKSVTTLVEMMSNSPLISFCIDSIHSSTATDWKRLFSVLQNHCNHSSLKRISLSASYVGTGGGLDKEMMTIRGLQPLLVFTNLTDITLNPPDGFDFEDQDIKTIAVAWPQVEILDLGPNSMPQARLRLSLHSLIPIARFCPKISRLTILVDATTMAPVSTRRVGQGIRNPTLTILDIGGSPIQSAMEVAAFVSDIFPEIDTIGLASRKFEENENTERVFEMWAEVEGLVPALSSIRKQEHDDAY